VGTESVVFEVTGKQQVFIQLNFWGEGMLTLHQFQMQKLSDPNWLSVCR
jgi:hypothetical protein